MKIGTSSSNTLISSSSANTSKFAIQATGKAFSILSNALYQYKVKAVVREIGCNAYDAHIDAKNTQTPFNVSLPTKEDPHFKVRDFGIGLAKDKFVEVYTTYFGSSKSESNDHTGGLGLGSKTPFIMSKTFTVHSYYNGIEYMWHSYVNDNGEPDVTLLVEKETTEPNGLLVVVPIGQGLSDTEKNALFREFTQEAEIIYRWFDVIPKVTANGKEVKITPSLHGTATKYSKIKLTGVDNTSVYYESEHSKHAQSAEIKVKMGNVVYPYKLNEVRNLDRFGGNIVKTQALITYLTNTGRLNSANFPLILEVGMGDVDIAPSREGLSLTNTTEVTIINALVRFVDMFFDKLQSNIDNAKTTFEKYNNLFAVPPIAGRTFTVDGKAVDPHKQRPVWMFGPQQSLAGNDNCLRKFETDRFAVKFRRAGTRGIIPLKNAADMVMYGPGAKERTILLIDKAYKGELRLWVNANVTTDSAVIVIFGMDPVTGTNRPLTAKEMEPFLEDGHPQVKKFSELKNQPVASTSRTGTTSLKLADDSMFVMRTTSSYNFFTQGNTDVHHVSNVKPVDLKSKKLDKLYVCFERSSNNVYAELQKEGTKTGETEMAIIASWSRSMSNNTSWCDGTAFIQSSFHKMPTELGIVSMTYPINGVDMQVQLRDIEMVVLNKDAYAEIVGNPDYPQFVTLHQAMTNMIIPALPTNLVVTELHHNSDIFTGGQSSSHWFYKLCNTMQWAPLIKWMNDLDSWRCQKDAVAINNFCSNTMCKERGYANNKGKQSITTYTYEVSLAGLMDALSKHAINSPSTAALAQAIRTAAPGHTSIRDVLTDGGYRDTATRAVQNLLLLAARSTSEPYDGDKLGEVLRDYFIANRKMS